MKNNFTLVKTLLLFLCLGVFSGVTAQIQFRYSASQFLAAPGQTDFEVDVRVSDFEDIVATQFAIVWDPAVLQIDSLPHISTTLPGLNRSSFSLPNQTNDMALGRVLCSWTDPSTFGASLPDNSFLFTMKFSVIGNPCDTTNIQLGVVPSIVTEAIDSDFVNIGINNLPSTIEIAGAGCNNFATALSCNSLVNVSLSPWAGNAVLTPDMILEGGPYNYSTMTVSPSELTCDDIGADVTVTVTDSSTGNLCWGLMRAEDKTPPVAIALVKNIVILELPSSGGLPTARLLAETVDNGSWDNCSEITFSPAYWDFDCSDIGIQDVVMTVMDGYGNFNSVISTIQVVDPAGLCDGFVETLSCNSLVNVSIGPWNPGTPLTPDMILEGGPYDFSAMTISPSEVSCDDIGTPITVTVTHESGNTCFGTVTVEDKLAPVAIAKQNIVFRLTQQAGGSFSGKLYAESVNNGSFDNCTDVTFDPAFWELDCSDIGVRDVTLNVIDAYGNVGTTWSTITVEIDADLSNVVCPDDVIVDDCSIDIENEDIINTILGGASLDDGCNLPFSDLYGYDANNDGDLNDTHVINSETFNESFNACQFGTILRTWYSWDSNETICEQVIAIKAPTEVFDGLTMIDWPYSLNAVTNIEDNDTGANCVGGCGDIDANDIALEYDTNGTLIGCSLTVSCSNALCEEPAFTSSPCSLIGFSTQTNIINLPNGDDKVIKEYVVIDWCSYDPNDSNSGGLWTYVVTATVIGGVNNVSFTASDVTGKKGDQVCVPVRVSNFRDIASFQGSLSWDESIASFDKITSFGLPGLSNSSFGLFDTDNGSLSFLWIDQTGTTPASLNDDSALFSVCFDVVGDVGETTDVSFENNPTSMEVSTETNNIAFTIKNGSVTVGENNCILDNEAPTPYCVNLSTALMQNGMVELWAQDFDLGSFDNCSPSNKLRYTFTNVHPDNDPNFSGRSSSKKYFASDIGNQPNATVTERMYVWDENGNVDFCQINLTIINNGGVGGNDDVTLQFGNVIANVGAQICMPLTVKDFSNVETMQASLNWDPSVAKFLNLSGFNVPGLSQSLFNLNSTSSGSLSFLWFDVTGNSPLTLTDGSSIFEVCFEAVGSPGDVSDVKFVNSPVQIEVTKPLSSGGVVGVNVVNGSFSILNSNCSIVESQITWPSPIISVYEPSAITSNASELLGPENLLTFEGVEYDHVYPTFDVEMECEGSIAHTYADQVFEAGLGQVKIIRTWTVLDWNTGSIFTFTQVIQNYLSGTPICDTLPNSAPFGDCASGHTSDDDVEWPDNVTIEDHRITPSELVTSSGVDPADAKPIFYNVPELYQTTYSDSVGGLNPTFLNIKRIWTVSRTDFPGLTWKYIQCIDVDLSDFGKLVTVSTINNRPLSNVMLNDNDMTNVEGLAYVEDEANPSRDDVLRNGLNIKDLMLIQASVLNNIELSDHEKVAADYNGDGSITAIDVFNVENILLGLETETSVDWRFNDITTEIESGLEPKGHYVAIKPGDVDDSADIGLENPVYLTENLIFEDQLLNAGETYMVPLYIGSDMQALGTELNLTFDRDKVEIESVNSDQVFGSISFNIINGDRLAMITENFDLSIEMIDSETPLLTIEVLATKNGTLKEVFGVSEIDESFILDSEYNLIRIDELIEGAIILDNENLDNTLAIDVYPNPAVDYLIVDDNSSFAGEKIRFELFDITGQRILNSVSQSQIDIAHLIPGMYVYKVTVGDKFTSGRILKQ